VVPKWCHGDAPLNPNRYTLGVPSVNLRLPEDLHARLVATAEAEHRSLQMQIVHLLEEGLRRRDALRGRGRPPATDAERPVADA
jgi:hypothetical protein